MVWNKPILSFDLDSTLCDTRHRQHIVNDSRARGEPVDWAEYAQACAEDTPTPLVSLVHTLQVAQVPWLVVSGRSETARMQTLEWLHRHNLYPKAVYLEDWRTEEHTALGHTEFKVRQVLEAQADFDMFGYRLTTHFDDWPEVAELLEERSQGSVRGVTVLPPGATVSMSQDNPGEEQEVL